jgi:FAD/FMN-containing dehydrogenase
VFKWYNPELDSELRAYSRNLHSKIREGGGTAVMKGSGLYSNYVGKFEVVRDNAEMALLLTWNEDYPTMPEKVFGANTKRLLEVKKKYDPDNLFFRWHNLLPEGIWA